MRRYLQGLLALCLLLSQAGWLDHLYHQHDLNHDEVCEQCLMGFAKDHAPTVSDSLSFLKPAYFLTPDLFQSDLRVAWTGPYLSRAPPHSL